MDMETVILEDNQEYYVLDILKVNNTKYMYLCEVTDKNNKNVCVRKLMHNDEYIVGLDSVSELDMALALYRKKYEKVVSAA
jgi:hypothetical protein